MFFCQEGEQREILVAVFSRFCKFSKGAFRRKSPISTGNNGQIRPGKLPHLNGQNGQKSKPVSMSLLWYLRRSIFQTPGRSIDSPGRLNLA